jgi:hypothetical protein
MGVVAGFFVGSMVGFALFRVYLRRHPRELAATEVQRLAEAAILAAEAPTEAAASAAVMIPRDIVEQLYEHLRGTSPASNWSPSTTTCQMLNLPSARRFATMSHS